MMETLNSFPVSLVMSLISFFAAFSLVQYKVNELRASVKMLIKKGEDDRTLFFELREADNKAMAEKLNDLEYKRELLKDVLLEKINNTDKNVIEIKTIVVQLNNKIN